MNKYDKRIARAVNTLRSGSTAAFVWNTFRLSLLPEEPLIAALCSAVLSEAKDLDLEPLLASGRLPGDPRALLDAMRRNNFDELRAYGEGRRAVLCGHAVALIACAREVRLGRTYTKPVS